MIAFLRGEILTRDKRSCTLLTSGGVGYHVALPEHTLKLLPNPGQPVSFHTSLVVREDAMELYGFETEVERDAFVVLRGVSRVGARTALSILSIFRPDELQTIVANEDPRPLAAVPGIGVKTAQHILLELKYKLKGLQTSRGIPASAAPSALGDALSALAGLGYPEEECGTLLRNLLKEEPDLEAAELIRLALKKLGKNK